MPIALCPEFRSRVGGMRVGIASVVFTLALVALGAFLFVVDQLQLERDLNTPDHMPVRVL